MNWKTPVPLRKEDTRFLTGKGRFISDITMDGMHHVYIVRSEKAHAEITSVECEDAWLTGVIGIYSYEDLSYDLGEVPMVWPVEGLKNPGHPLLADKIVRYIGEPILIIIADHLYTAKQAAKWIRVDYKELPSITSLNMAIKNEDRTRIHPDIKDNIAYEWKRLYGDEGSKNKGSSFIEQRLVIPRVAPLPLETRGIIAYYDKTNDLLSIWSSTQMPHVLRMCLANCLQHREQRIEVTAPDIGGAFGSKMNVYREEILVAYFAKTLKLPLKYIETRSENFTASTHGRDQIQDIKLYHTDGLIQGMEITIHANMGAYLQAATTGIPIYTTQMLSGCYDIPYINVKIKAYYTNQTPTDAYRGAGRPEATYLVESMMDRLAKECLLDPADIRRKNFIKAGAFPKKVVTGLTYDSGNYEKTLNKLIEVSELEKWRRLQKERRERNSRKQIGIGLSTYVEFCGTGPSKINKKIGLQTGGFESAVVRMLPTGMVEVISGVCSSGQGHQTSLSLIVERKLGCLADEIEVTTSRASLSPWGSGTYGSRSIAVGGSAIDLACDKLIQKGKKFLAVRWKSSLENICFYKGIFLEKDGRKMSLKELTGILYLAHDLPEGFEPGLEATVFFEPSNYTFPFGAHLCVIEIDSETGDRSIVAYTAVDDFGNVIHEKIAEGQLLGGIMQGIGESLYEEIKHDKDSGSMSTHNLRTYEISKTVDAPYIHLFRTKTPTSINPLGAKGVGEAGAIAAPPAVMNAVKDALKIYRVKDINMPATKRKIWEAIHLSQEKDDE
ncbi:xanthine dehydrogenase family protein molybdopterin-binding subunit [Bacillus halotolerans]|uniref:xanthine dehydrogenase family protein molybdopterin-binding subunit n=1 Tax=Bacillus halotolerans TaxID=260554 RepID=UPI00403F2334